MPAAGEEHPPDDPSLSASTEEFQFSGPAEELDFTEPADFTFPTEQAAACRTVGRACPRREHVGAEQAFGAEEGSAAESPLPEEAAAEAEMAGEGIADLEVAEEPSEERTQAQVRVAGLGSNGRMGHDRRARRGRPAGRHHLDYLGGQESQAGHAHLEHRLPRDVGADSLCLMAIHAALGDSGGQRLVHRHAGVEHGGLDCRHVVRGAGTFALRLAVFQGPGKCRQAAAW